MSYNLVDPTTGELTKVAGNASSSVIIDDSTASGNKTWSSEKINVKLDGKADKNAVPEFLEATNDYTTAQIIPWNDGVHFRSYEDKSSDTYTDIVANNGIAIIARTENGKQTKSEELATMDKVANSIIRESRSTLYNLNNVDYIEVAIDIAKSGYKPIAVSLFNSGTHLWFAQGMYFNDTVCNLSLRGVTPTSITNAECEVLVTYIKTS